MSDFTRFLMRASPRRRAMARYGLADRKNAARMTFALGEVYRSSHFDDNAGGGDHSRALLQVSHWMAGLLRQSSQKDQRCDGLRIGRRVTCE